MGGECMSLLHRRSLMGSASNNKFLYPLADSTMHAGYAVTTSSNGHVVVEAPARQTGNKYLNFRDPAKYPGLQGGVINNSMWFKLLAGQTVTFASHNLPSVMELSLYIANFQTVYKRVSSSTPTVTFMVEEDVEIGCVGGQTTSAVAAGTKFEFDIALYVDGRRYF